MISKIKKLIYHPIKNFIAKYYLIILRQFTNIKVIGITGSAGKTTTKEMVASILKKESPTVWSKENIDPVYNIPSTILKCRLNTKYLVLEMGIEYPNEMDFYLSIVKPDVGVITNIFPTHTQHLGNISGVLKEKSKMVLALGEDEYAILNSNDKRLRDLSNEIKCKIVWFESDQDPIIQNMNTATAVAKVLGISHEKIAAGLESYEKPKHRFEVLKHDSGAVIYDDSYNSNPEAAIISIKKFVKLAKSNKKVAILGDMLELGDYEISGHKKVGSELAKLGFDTVIGIGKRSKYIISEVEKQSPKVNTYQFDTIEDALQTINTFLRKDRYIFIKGSRSIGLDKLVSLLFH